MIRFCVDANVIMRLQDVQALGALASLTDCRFILTDTVWDEVTRKAGVGTAAKTALAAASPTVTVHWLQPGSEEAQHYTRLRENYPPSQYDDGELSVIALCATQTDLVPVIFERRGHIAGCDELCRTVFTGHWFYRLLEERHGLPASARSACSALLAKNNGYPKPTWAS